LISHDSVGVNVNYEGGTQTPGSRGKYKVVRQLPVERDNRVVYRIKSVAETFERPEYDTLRYVATIDDPGAYTKPFTLFGHSTLETGTDIIEYICNENNQDVIHIMGRDRDLREGQ